MAAVLTEPRSPHWSRVDDGRHLVLYRPGMALAAPGSNLRAGRPRPARLGSEVYRRRRLLAGGLILLFFAAVLVSVQLIQAGIGGGPLTTTGAAAGPGMIQAGAAEYIVRPGDTLWTIAAALAPGRDERPIVDQLAAQIGGSSIYPGQVISLSKFRTT